MAESRKLTVLVLSWIVLLGACSPGPESDPTPAAAPASDPSEVHREVEQAVYSFFQLSEQRNWDAVGGLMAPEFEIYTDGATSFPRAEYIELLKSDDLVMESWEIEDLEISVSPDAAMAWCRYRGRFFMTTGEGGERHDVETAETLVFENRGGLWRIVQAHASIKALE